MSTQRQTRGKKKEKESAQTDSEDKEIETGFYQSESEEQGTPIRKRKSLRLKQARERKESDSETDEQEHEEDEEESKTETKSNKRKRSVSAAKESNDGSPPKKRQKASSTRSRQRCLAVPCFFHDTELLQQIGIAYTKKKAVRGGKAKLFYKKQLTVDGDEYHYHSTGKYELVQILGHTVRHEPEVVLEDYANERDWYKSIDWKAVQRRLDANDKEMSNGHENDDAVDGAKKKRKSEKEEEEEEAPQCQFGRVYFECKWAKWPETTWEQWHTIAHTEVFEKYCEQNTMLPAHPLEAVLTGHSPEHFLKILRNMAYFGSPSTRKALKQIINNEMNIW